MKTKATPYQDELDSEIRFHHKVFGEYPKALNMTRECYSKLWNEMYPVTHHEVCFKKMYKGIPIKFKLE